MIYTHKFTASEKEYSIQLFFIELMSLITFIASQRTIFVPLNEPVNFKSIIFISNEYNNRRSRYIYKIENFWPSSSNLMDDENAEFVSKTMFRKEMTATKNGFHL